MTGNENNSNSSFEIKLWPISKQSRYVEVRNPDYFSTDSLSQLDYIPTKVIGYQNETEESLRQIQKQSSDKLNVAKEPIIKEMKEKHEGGNLFQTLYTTMFGVYGYLGPVTYINNPEITIPVGAVLGTAVLAGSGAVYIKRRRNLKRGIKEFNNNIRKFGSMPVQKFEVVPNEELADLYNAIKNNEPLKITKPISEEDFNSINTMVDEIGSVVSPFPTQIYEQKLATYQAPPKKPLFNFSFNLRKKV
jgi:hypothetical protein